MAVNNMKGYLILSFYYVLVVAAHGNYQNSKHSAEGPIYDGLKVIINDAKEHVQLIADDLTQKINTTLVAIKEKVDQLEDRNTFTKEIEALKSGEKVQSCLKEHEVPIAQFMRKVVNGYEACSKDVKQEVNDVLGKLQEQVRIIQGASKKIDAIGKECVAKNEDDAAASVLCVVSRIPGLQEKVFEANQSVEKFINNGVESVETLSINKCGEKELRKEFDSLLDKIEACVKKQSSKQ